MGTDEEIQFPTSFDLQEYTEKGENEQFQTITNVRDDRWERLPHLNPPGVKIIRRGKGKEYVATISKTGQFAGLYESWEPILAELERQKVTNGGKRVKHNALGGGVHPELGVGKDSVFAARDDRQGGELGLLRNPITNADLET